MLICCSVASAQEPGISIIPGWWSNDVWELVSHVWQWGHVWEIYNDTLKTHNLSLAEKFASGIMDWDTILDYCVYLVKFLWQIALLIWAVAIIYLWYKRIVKNIVPENSSGFGKIILWLVVVIFAYVIVKLIWSAFIS